MDHVEHWQTWSEYQYRSGLGVQGLEDEGTGKSAISLGYYHFIFCSGGTTFICSWTINGSRNWSRRFVPPLRCQRSLEIIRHFCCTITLEALREKVKILNVCFFYLMHETKSEVFSSDSLYFKENGSCSRFFFALFLKVPILSLSLPSSVDV